MAELLVEAVRQFVQHLSAALDDLDRAAESGRTVRDNTAAAHAEALQAIAAIVAADGEVSDVECNAIIAAFGAEIELVQANATPRQLRSTDVFHRARPWPLKPSRLAQDVFRRSRELGLPGPATAYFHAILDLGHAAAAVDAASTDDEVAALDRLRRTLLNHAVEAGVGLGSRAEFDGAAPAATTPREDLETVLAELDALVGLEPVKREVRLISSLAKVQRMRGERGMKQTDTSRHLVFTGNPGTGKTTVARLIARIFHSLGYLDRGHLVEVDRSGLVAGYVGQTAARVSDVFESARGGVLLIDEAYALARGDERDFGREAIDTIVKLAEDRRDDTIVILTGYTDEMSTLIGSNPGMDSRFPRSVFFPDYSNDELVEIFERMVAAQDYAVGDGVTDAVRQVVTSHPRGTGFGNARHVRNLFEEILGRHAVRIADIATPTDDQLRVLTVDDVPPAASAN